MKIKRKIQQEIENHLVQKEISVITGARQVGKTTMLLEIYEKILEQGKSALFLNLDNDTEYKYFSSQDRFLQKLELEIGKQGYIFIDEIQRLENAGLFMKGLYDRKLQYKFIISGSGSLELKAKISESLLGRKRPFEMMPVNFTEFVNYKTNYKYEDNIDLFFDVEKDKTLLLLDEYINFGGYPRIITEPQLSEKLKLIDEIFKTYVEKDLVYLLGIERPEVFKTMIKMLATQIGNIMKYSDLAKQLNISIQTLKKYLWYAEKTFCIYYVSPYYTNTLKEITKAPVYYFNDIGLRNYAINLMGNLELNQQYGFVFQNFVFLQLKEYIRWKNWSLHFWRTSDKTEVDFVINKGNTLLPVEVKYSEFKKPVISRSFRSFISKYKPSDAWLINKNFESEIYIENTKVHFLPFYKLVTLGKN